MNSTIPQVLCSSVDESAFMSDDTGGSWAMSLVLSICNVACHSSFPTPCKEDGDDVFAQQPFPLSVAGLKYVEEYLSTMVKPFVTKWDTRNARWPVISKAQIDGRVYLGAHARKELDHRFIVAGTVLGQVIAQECGMKWISDPKGDLPGLGKGQEATCWPWAKVRKFTCYGEEDGLAGFITSIQNTERNDRMCAEVKKALEEAGKLKRGTKYL